MIDHELFVYCQHLMTSHHSLLSVRATPQLVPASAVQCWLGLSLSPELGFGGKFRKLVTASAVPGTGVTR